MPMTKHVGRLISTGKKVVVIFREIYNENGKVIDPSHALIVDTDALPNLWADAFMDAVLSSEGQDTINFYEVCMRKTLPDGRFILNALVQEGRMVKVRTNDVQMEPDNQVRIVLHELNLNLNLVTSGAKEPTPLLTPEEAIKRNTEQDESLQDATVNNADDMRAFQLRTQATMLREDADKLEAQANQISPDTAKPKRGRPKKVAATADAD